MKRVLETQTHFTHTCPADDCSYSIMSIHRAGFNGIYRVKGAYM